MPENGYLILIAHHDEDAEAHLNGTLVESLKGATRHYGPMLLGDAARKLLQVGENVLAVALSPNDKWSVYRRWINGCCRALGFES